MCNQFEKAPSNMADTTCVRVLLDLEPSKDVVCFCSDLRARSAFNVVEGWALTPNSRKKQPQTSAGKLNKQYKQPNNLLNRRKGSATPEKYVFQHFDDVGSYMRDYRQKYTCLGKQELIESPVMSEDGDSIGDSASTITRVPREMAEIPEPDMDPSVSMPTNRQRYSSPSSEEDAVSMTTSSKPAKAHSVSGTRTSDNTLQVPATAGLSKITVQTNRLPDQQRAAQRRGPSLRTKLIAKQPVEKTTGSEDIRRPSSAEAVFLSPVGGYLSASPSFGAFRKYHRKQNYQQVGKEKRRLAEMYGIANLSSTEAQQLEIQQGPCPSPRLLVTCKNAPVVKNGALVVEKGSSLSTPKMPPWPVRPKSQSLKSGSNRALDGYVVWDASEGKWTINTTYVAALMTYNQATPDVGKMLRQYMSASAKKGPASL